jgi:hypothetical protein
MKKPHKPKLKKRKANKKRNKTPASPPKTANSRINKKVEKESSPSSFTHQPKKSLILFSFLCFVKEGYPPPTGLVNLRFKEFLLRVYVVTKHRL